MPPLSGAPVLPTEGIQVRHLMRSRLSPLSEVKVVTAPAAKPVPVKRSEDVNLLVEDTDTYILGQQIQDETGRNKVLSVVDGEVNGHGIKPICWHWPMPIPSVLWKPDMDSDIGSHPKGAGTRRRQHN